MHYLKWAACTRCSTYIFSCIYVQLIYIYIYIKKKIKRRKIIETKIKVFNKKLIYKKANHSPKKNKQNFLDESSCDWQ